MSGWKRNFFGTLPAIVFISCVLIRSMEGLSIFSQFGLALFRPQISSIKLWDLSTILLPVLIPHPHNVHPEK